MARQSDSSTVTANPSLAASSAEKLTQKSVARPTIVRRLIPPVLRQYHRFERRHPFVYARDDFISAWHGKGPAGAEVVLHVDHDQGFGHLGFLSRRIDRFARTVARDCGDGEAADDRMPGGESPRRFRFLDHDPTRWDIRFPIGVACPDDQHALQDVPGGECRKFPLTMPGIDASMLRNLNFVLIQGAEHVLPSNSETSVGTGGSIDHRSHRGLWWWRRKHILGTACTTNAHATNAAR